VLPSQPSVLHVLAIYGSLWVVNYVAYVTVNRLVDELGYAVGWLLVRYERLRDRQGLKRGERRPNGRIAWAGIGATLDPAGRSIAG